MHPIHKVWMYNKFYEVKECNDIFMNRMNEDIEVLLLGLMI